MKTLIGTIGLPRSGKSTWAREQIFPIVNPDAIRFALYGEIFISEAEKMVWTIAHYMVQSLFFAGHDKVILDATNTTPRRRNEWLSSEWRCEWKIFDTSKEVCIERAKKGGREDLIPIIEMMHKSLDLSDL